MKITAKFQPYMPLFFQVFRFGLVGVTAAAFHFAIVVYLVQQWQYLPLSANVLAVLFSFQVSYWGHKLWTFDSEAKHSTALPKLILVQSLAFGMNESLFFVFLSWHIPYQLALILVLMIVPIFTFIASRLWVFKAVA